MTVTTALFTGLILGLSGGLSPGPLLTLVVSETLRYGAREGIKASMAPLLTDLPIVSLALLSVGQLSNTQSALGLLSLLGAMALAYYGFESLRFRGIAVELDETKPRSLRKAVIANLLNPNPYLFWFSIGAPLVINALQAGTSRAALLVVSFYLVLTGSKAFLALIVGRSRRFLGGGLYVTIVRALGLALLLFALLFLRDGLRLLGAY
jgi:threonine/homoserine/homoserine lactone efflux protein